MATAMETAAAPLAATPTAPAMTAADKLDAVVIAAEREHRKAIAEASQEYRRFVRIAVDGGDLSNADAARLAAVLGKLKLDSKAFRSDVAVLTRAMANARTFEFDDAKFAEQQRERGAKSRELKADLDELEEAVRKTRAELNRHNAHSSNNAIGRQQSLQELQQNPRLFGDERGGIVHPLQVGAEKATTTGKQRSS